MKPADKHPVEVNAVGYFKARHNNIEIYNSTSVNVHIDPPHIAIESHNFGFPDNTGFSLIIDQSTASGEQPFVPGGKLNSVIYHSRTGDHRATRGTFNANLDNINKKYRISFKLVFADPGEIEGELDVTV
ncbi:hypothetical protein [Pseudomonas vancouverensis]|uniref:Uncharacterized protein n=1 Tax=Pseudomonas vancouverensis TaxID=95300 RepID=A0A1H2M5A6_PSEVA|nr:hypothetical protein [Pseudomonas vancouverensis]KAB0498781.1 hypothetical protein F7R09_05580 [Pseudomonas vancouverensis]TDB57478.1 hypothetical protein EIY72_24750 [Pseudomonas vancouverensis]SDU88118.1 hypothetical protein SAMN05216558_0236 [Pseudomonas vancouverensis]